MPFMFEKLEVYQKALEVAVKISGHTDTFPKGKYYLIDQLNRAALSISANLAEGNGRWHKNERKQFFWIARGSAQECVPINRPRNYSDGKFKRTATGKHAKIQLIL